MDRKKKVGCHGGYLEPSVWRLREVEWSEILMGFTAWLYLNLNLRRKKENKKSTQNKKYSSNTAKMMYFLYLQECQNKSSIQKNMVFEQNMAVHVCYPVLGRVQTETGRLL